MLDKLTKKNITWREAKRTAKIGVCWRSTVDALCSPEGVKMPNTNTKMNFRFK